MRSRRHHERQGADRDVNQKQPSPGRDRKDRRRDAWASRRGHGDDHRHIADALAELRVRVDESDERNIDAHDPGGTQTLHQPSDRQRVERWRDRTGERGKGEQREPGPVDPAIANRVAERRQRQQRYCDCELKGVNDPDRILRRNRQFARHSWQCNIDDVPVQHGHRYRHGEGRKRQQALRVGEAVRDLSELGDRHDSPRRKQLRCLTEPDSRSPYLLELDYAGIDEERALRSQLLSLIQIGFDERCPQLRVVKSVELRTFELLSGESIDARVGAGVQARSALGGRVALQHANGNRAAHPAVAEANSAKIACE
jgi:hypothetical protein